MAASWWATHVHGWVCCGQKPLMNHRSTGHRPACRHHHRGTSWEARLTTLSPVAGDHGWGHALCGSLDDHLDVII